MEKLVTLKQLGETLRSESRFSETTMMLDDLDTGYSVSTCFTFDKHGRTIGRIITAYHNNDEEKNMLVSVNGKPRVFKTLAAVEKAMGSIKMMSFVVYMA